MVTVLFKQGCVILGCMTLPAPTPADWLVPDWPAPAGVRALCTTRCGGFSDLTYDSMNLGSHVGDDPDTVAHNRAVLHATTVARPVFLNQVHGTQVLALDAAISDGLTADGAFTRTRGLACTVMVADCLPVLMCDRGGSVVAAVHAGWRGLAGGAGTGQCKFFVSDLFGEEGDIGHRAGASAREADIDRLHAQFGEQAQDLPFGIHGGVGHRGALNAVSERFIMDQDLGNGGIGGQSLDIPIVDDLGFIWLGHGYLGAAL